MADKPRIRIPAGSGRKAFVTGDSFQNFAADMGIGANNLLSQSTYGFNPIGRYHIKLEWMYRGSWLVRKVVDCPADDMTRAGIDFSSDMKPDAVDQLHSEWKKLALWNKIREGIKWGRLYGGAIAVIMIEGQRMDTPLRMETIAKGDFKGLLILDRWMINPELGEFVEDMGPEFGLPLYYDTITDGSVPQMHIHHSRVIRFEGDAIPYWQRIAENGWTVSVIEQLQDRLLAFDSASTGAAQLVYKAHLRTYKVPGLRELIASGGTMYQAFLDNMAMIRAMQTNEGLTLIDGEDEIEYHNNGAFGGLSDAMISFGQQLSGAAGIPLVILFGQSPTGLNSTGESDVRNYYDRISSAQNMNLNSPVDKIARCLYWSTFGEAPPPEFGFSFNPLWQLTETERATNASTIANAVKGVFDSGIIEVHTALAELKQSSHETGVFSNITDEQILEAKLNPPAPTEMGDPGADPMMGHNGGPPLQGPPDASGAPPAAIPPPAAPEGPSAATIAELAANNKPGPAPANENAPFGVPAQPAADPRDPPAAPGMFRLGGTPENVKVNVAAGTKLRVNYNMGDAIGPYNVTWGAGGLGGIVTSDEGKFDESKIKRDEGGKFSHYQSHAEAAGVANPKGEAYVKKEENAHWKEAHEKLIAAGYEPEEQGPTKEETHSSYTSELGYSHKEHGHSAILGYQHSWGRNHNTKTTKTELFLNSPKAKADPGGPAEADDPKAAERTELAAHNAALAAEVEPAKDPISQKIDSVLASVKDPSDVKEVNWAAKNAYFAHLDANPKDHEKAEELHDGIIDKAKAMTAPEVLADQPDPTEADPVPTPKPDEAPAAPKKLDIALAKKLAAHADFDPTYKNEQAKKDDKKFHPNGQKYLAKQKAGIEAALQSDDPIGALEALKQTDPTWAKKPIAHKEALIKALKEQQAEAPAPAAPAPKPEAKPAEAPAAPKAVKPNVSSKVYVENTKTLVSFKHHVNEEAAGVADYSKKMQGATQDHQKGEVRETWASSHYDSLSAHQRGAVTAYQGSGYSAMNRQLAGLAHSSDTTQVENRIKNMKKAMDKSFIPESMDLTRGIRANLNAVTGLDDPQAAVGGIFEHKGFVSSSHDANVASKFAGEHGGSNHVIMKFNIPAGTKALMMRGQGVYSKTIREKEVVLPSNSMFRIDKVEQSGSKGHIVHCTYLGEKT